jgi:hypothetical protein
MNITSLLNPSYMRYAQDWDTWRTVYEGGEQFVDDYLERFSSREDATEFAVRKRLTPIPSFAKSAIKDVRNNIFQRMSGVTRTGGSPNYMSAVKGESFGVDNRGSSMTSFIGQHLLDELLVMGKVGVFVDAPATATPTLLGQSNFKPYIYSYRVEDILNWVKNDPQNPSEFQHVLLRESVETFHEEYGFPTGYRTRNRRVWINEETGLVNYQFLEEIEGKQQESPVVELQLRKIPFVLFDIKHSLIEDVARHQIALLNLWSSNVQYASQANFPVYTEQRDARAFGTHLKNSANSDGTATSGGQGANDNSIKVGVARGRSYDMNAERPGFISPSAEPLLASLELCNTLKKDIRELINLAVVNLGTQASAESKNLDNSGLEAGLSFIGLVLEAGEREIARHWAAYENVVESKRQVANIAYPERWSLKTDQEKIKDATDLHAVVNKLPSRKAKKETTKLLIQSLLGAKIPAVRMAEILAEVESANFTTSDPEIIRLARENGLLGAETGAKALGFNAEEAEIASQEHIDRLTEIAKHQTTGIQGVADTQADPKSDNKNVQTKSRDRDSKAAPANESRGKTKIN